MLRRNVKEEKYLTPHGTRISLLLGVKKRRETFGFSPP